MVMSAPHVRPVAVQPLGDVEPSVIEHLADQLKSFAGVPVTVLPAQPLPSTAFYAPRNRYRGDKLLEYLDQATPKDYAHVIGITSRDISVTKDKVFDWGVFGVAQLKGRPGIVSTYRLHARSASEALFTSRVEHIASHELGHALGLPHCTSPRCMMNDAEGGIGPVDAADGHLCDDCLKRLRAILSPTPALVAPIPLETAHAEALPREAQGLATLDVPDRLAAR